jgi:hypothetical protein
VSIPVLDPDEIEALSELRDIQTLINSPGWTLRLRPLLESLVNEAEEEMLGAVFATTDVKASMLTRWQQRKAMLRAVLQYIESCETKRKRILEEIEERRKAETQQGVPLEELYVNEH